MGDGTTQPPSILLGFLIIASAFFAMAETAVSCVSKTKIKSIAEKGNSVAAKTLAILDNFENAITALLICTNIAHISFASVVTIYVQKRWGLDFISLSTVIATVVMYLIAEMLPKSLAKKQSTKIALFCTPLLFIIMKICKPFSFILTKISSLFAKKELQEDLTVTEDELQEIIEDMTEEGTFNENESSLITSALQFGEVTAESILTPRVDIKAINIDDNKEKILEFIKTQTHSRIPVYKNTIDNIIGVIQIRKYLKAYLHSGKAPEIKPLLDKVYYAHQSTEIHEILPRMSKEKLNMAVITDNWGGTLGIITVEDILEELVGEIWDEDDVIQESIVKKNNNTYIAKADESVADLFEFMEFNDPDSEERDNANTVLGEWAFEQFPSIPIKGDTFTYHNLKISVAKIVKNRILSLKIEVLPQEGETIE